MLPLVDSSLDFDESIFLYPDHRDAAATARSSSGFSDFEDKTVALLRYLSHQDSLREWPLLRKVSC